MKAGFVKTAIAAAICSFVAGCHDHNSSGAPPAPGPGPSGNPTLSGKAVAGPVSGATVKIYALTSTGTDGALLGSGTTDGTGAFSVQLSSAPSGGVRVEVSGGSYESEADVTVTSTSGLLTVLLSSVPSDGVSGIAVNPLTTFADAHSVALLAGSAPASTGKRPKELTLPSAVTQGLADIAALFGFGSTVDLATLLANFDAATGDAGQLALALGALEQLAMQTGHTPAEIIAALVQDLSDAIPDGKTAAGGTAMYDSTHPAPPTLGNNDLLGALTTYLSSARANSYLTRHAVTPDPTIIGNLRGGIIKYAPAAASLNVGSSGAITSLAYNGKQVVLVAARERGLHLIDITDPTTPVEDPLATLNTALQALATPFGDVGGVIALPGSVDPTALLFSYAGKRVVIANIATQAIVQDVDLSAVLSTQTSFSGGVAYISGGIADPKRNVIWLATGDGYIPFNLATNVADPAVPLVPTQNFIAENIGGDITNDLLFSPNYGGAGYGGGVQVVNLATKKAYALDDTLFQSAFAVPGGGGSFSIVDSGAVDSSYRVGVMVGEDVPYVGFLDMHNPSSFSYNDTDQSFSFSPSTLALTQLVAPSYGIELSGAAIDSTTHLALLMAGYSTDILVGKIDNPVAPTGSSWAGFTDWKYYSANSSEYRYARDPHAVAAVNSSANGHSYGFLLSDDGYALMIDMQAFFAAAATPASSGGDDHVLAATPFDGTVAKRIALTTTSSLKAAGKAATKSQKHYATKSKPVAR